MNKRYRQKFFGLIFLLILLGVNQLFAQTPPASRLFITESNTSGLPIVELRLYGLKGDGTPLDFNNDALLIRHGGDAAEATVGRQVAVGTFTIFLFDVTSSVADQIPTIQQLMEQFASPTYMAEQVDYVAFYWVGPTQAEQVLPPTNFYNSIRNFFATPLEPHDGPTALVDSLVGLLDSVEGLKPKPELFTSIVVISDGTDAVSTLHTPDEVAAKGEQLTIPVHTVWLQNPALSTEAGREFLTNTSNGSRGMAGQLDQPDSVTAIWGRIAAFRNQTLIQYPIPNLTNGTFPVEVSLLHEATARDDIEITVSTSIPSVTLNLAAENRSLTLPNLDQPVRLSLSASVGWLDGTQRTLQQAQLLVNGQAVQTLDVDQLDQFEAEITNFVFGNNTIQIAVVDEQGSQAISPEIVILVNEGDEQIPEALQPSASPLRLLLYCVLVLVVIILLGAGGYFLYQSGLLTRSGRDNQTVEAEGPDDKPPAEAGQTFQPYLEVITAETQIPGRINIESVDVRLGRSPSLVEIAFENDTTVSRQHATISWDGHTFRIYDDNSTSGTWVNDQQVGEHGVQLFDNDSIFLGKVHLRFHYN